MKLKLEKYEILIIGCQKSYQLMGKRHNKYFCKEELLLKYFQQVSRRRNVKYFEILLKFYMHQCIKMSMILPYHQNVFFEGEG